jgi:hypothetical protein
VNALDLVGASSEQRVELARQAADTVKRVLAIPEEEPDWTEEPSLSRMKNSLELKTVWHPMGV